MPPIMSATILFLALAAAPAAARSRAEPIADPVQGSVDASRFRGGERSAVERCAPQVERYGRMRIDEVRRDGRGGWRVEGTVAGAGIGDTRGGWRGYAPRAFTCTVREDGRVKLETSRLRR
jgi:hypothetical protein